MKSLVAFLLVVTVFPAFAQLLDVRHDSETTEQYCARIEKLKPNLVLSHPVELSGRIIDGSGAPFKKSVVELRVYESGSKQTLIRKTVTDQDGNFDLAKVEKGRYRLLASPTRLFEQPGGLRCNLSDKCVLQMTLQVNPTDMPTMFCPVR